MTDAEIIADAKNRTPGAAKEIDALASAKGGFGCIVATEFEETIRKDVLFLREEKALEGVEIRGLAFDIEEGIVRIVE